MTQSPEHSKILLNAPHKKGQNTKHEWMFPENTSWQTNITVKSTQDEIQNILGLTFSLHIIQQSIPSYHPYVRIKANKGRGVQEIHFMIL